MKKLIFLCFGIFFFNKIQAQPQCLKKLNQAKEFLTNIDCKTSFKEISDFQIDFSITWRNEECGFDDEFVFLFNEIQEKKEEIREREGVGEDFSFDDFFQEDVEYFINQKNANIRVAPSIESPKLTSLSIGTAVNINEITLEDYKLGGMNFPWVEITFNMDGVKKTGYVLAKFISMESFKQEETLILLSPVYNCNPEYKVQAVKNKKEIGNIIIEGMYPFDVFGLNIYEHNIKNVIFFHIEWLIAACGRIGDDFFLVWDGKKFNNISNDIGLQYGEWKFDDSKKKIIISDEYYFCSNCSREKHEIDSIGNDVDHITFPNPDCPAEKIYSDIQKIYYWNGAEFKISYEKNKILKSNLNKQNGKWYHKGSVFSGILFENYSNGELKLERKIKNGIEQEEEFEYYHDGKLKCITNWKDGKWNGYKIWYNENGEIEKEAEYLDWQLVEGINTIFLIEEEIELEFDTEGEEEIEFEEAEEVDEIVDFTVVETLPIFPGCERRIYKWTDENKESLSEKREEDLRCLNQGIIKHIKENYQ